MEIKFKIHLEISKIFELSEVITNMCPSCDKTLNDGIRESK